MKILLLFPYPVESDGVSLQGHYLHKGLLDAGAEVMPCHHADSLQKEFYLRYFKPDICIGVGFWGGLRPFSIYFV